MNAFMDRNQPPEFDEKTTERLNREARLTGFIDFADLWAHHEDPQAWLDDTLRMDAGW